MHKTHDNIIEMTPKKKYVETHRKFVPVVRLGGLAPARPIMTLQGRYTAKCLRCCLLYSIVAFFAFLGRSADSFQSNVSVMCFYSND